MAVKQLSAFIQNEKGSLSGAVKVISKADINIRAMSIGDTEAFGILRMIVSDTDKAKAILEEDTIVSITDVLAVKMDDKEGALYKILQVLEEADINVEYTYAFTAHAELGAYVVFRVGDVAAAETILTAKGFSVLTDEDIKNI